MKPYAVLDISRVVPDEVRDEEYMVTRGETLYTLHPSDAQMELLAQGVVDEALAQRAWRMIAWKREQSRGAARRRK